MVDYFSQVIQYTDHKSIFQKLSEVRKLSIESPLHWLRDKERILVFALGDALNADWLEFALLEDAEW